MKKKEMEAFLQVKRTCELAEEIQLQKQEVTDNSNTDLYSVLHFL